MLGSVATAATFGAHLIKCTFMTGTEYFYSHLYSMLMVAKSITMTSLFSGVFLCLPTPPPVAKNIGRIECHLHHLHGVTFL